jgi:hypothetical protein
MIDYNNKIGTERGMPIKYPIFSMAELSIFHGLHIAATCISIKEAKSENDANMVSRD